MENQTMGERISTLRKERGMTQRDLAEKMNVTDKAVSKWERNLSCPDVGSIPRLAQVLGVSVEELMTVSVPEKDTALAKREKLTDLILCAVPLAMGVAVTVLGILDRSADPGTCLSGVGLLSVGIYLMRQNRFL